MLSVGHTARASVTVDSLGNPITGRLASWTSLKPSVATVSSAGEVAAIASGTAEIQANVGGITGSTSLTVTDMAASNFDDGTLGAYLSGHITSQTEVVDDPTHSGRGKVAQIKFQPIQSNLSDDQYLQYRTYDAGKIRYGRTIWFKGEVYLPTNPFNDPNWRPDEGRKILDWQGQSDDGWTSGGARWVLYQQLDNQTGTHNILKISSQSPNLVQSLYYELAPQINLQFDSWHTIEVKMVTNSADGVHDGSLAFYIDNPSDTPTWTTVGAIGYGPSGGTTPTGLYWITESWAPLDSHGIPVVGSYFNDLKVGSQYSSALLAPEYRYWDNVAFSTTRIGH
ncbi:MAG: Ig-like domain-containing protein [Gemmatimonadota bacterium]|nr:Ig-like domain-containing protein [Gemmatimonadota bacterium]